jgi:hypothetical protein
LFTSWLKDISGLFHPVREQSEAIGRQQRRLKSQWSSLNRPANTELPRIFSIKQQFFIEYSELFRMTYVRMSPDGVFSGYRSGWFDRIRSCYGGPTMPDGPYEGQS